MKTKETKNKTKIPTLLNVRPIDAYLESLRNYLSYCDQKFVVANPEKEAVLKKLEGDTEKGKFSFIINGLEERIQHIYGVEQWLGYKHKDFTIETFLDIVHPSHAIPYWLNGTAIWDLLVQHRELATFNDISTMYTLALKTQKGRFYFCSCDSFFLQVSANGIGTELGYNFTILKGYDIDDFNVSFLDKGNLRADLLDLHVNCKKKIFKSSKLFTSQELRILWRLAYNADSTASKIAAAFKTGKHTMYGHNKNILEKARVYFHQEYKDTKHFAERLKFMNFI